MRFVKLEGDAVFCFASGDAFPDGEQLIELVESCYFDFSSRLLDMTRSTTCRCDACRAIGGLDLKFVVHFGQFWLDRDEDGRIDLAGPDVILTHRLLKNTIIEAGGPTAYAFFSDPCIAGPVRDRRRRPFGRWWRRSDSNRRPPACKAGALPLSYAPEDGAPGSRSAPESGGPGKT